MVSSETKKKQRPKKGRVARLSPDLVRLIDLNRREGETVPSVIRRLIFEEPISAPLFVLPSDLHDSAEDARGAAIIRAVRGKNGKIEKPIKVREVK